MMAFLPFLGPLIIWLLWVLCGLHFMLKEARKCGDVRLTEFILITFAAVCIGPLGVMFSAIGGALDNVVVLRKRR